MTTIAGRLYHDGKLEAGVMSFEEDRITDIEFGGDASKADHNFGDLAILPAALDIHVHMRDPGHTHKEDLHTGTVSAAFGGVTTVVDMPNTLPSTTNPQAVAAKRETAAEKAVIDVGLYAGATWYTEGLPELLKGCLAIKTYLGATTGDLLLDDPDALPRIFAAAADAGKPVALHAEAQRVLDQNRRTENVIADHDTARPPIAEVESIYDAMKVAATMKNPPKIHIAHAASADAVRAAMQAGFSIGSCPHHLFLSTEQAADAPNPNHFKMNPPLRSAASRDALWAHFAAGDIPIIESDHAPHSLSEKAEPFAKAPAGVPGVETMVPLLLAKVKQGAVDLRIAVDAATKNPAALMGLNDRGELAVGKRADFAVYDLDAIETIDASKLHSKCGWSPYDGMEAIFPHHVWRAGAPVITDRTLVAKAGDGDVLG